MWDSCLMSTLVLIRFILHTTHFILYSLVQGSVVDWCQIEELLYCQQCQVEDGHFKA